VIVITTTLPASAAAGVYVIENGEVAEEAGLTDPAPSSVMVTAVVLPLNVLPVIVTGVLPHTLPLVAPRMTAGGLTHPHSISKTLPNVTQPSAFLTER
jgi:hypothetical protein